MNGHRPSRPGPSDGRRKRLERPQNGSRGNGEPSRVAVISLHTSPKDQPGTGDSGGMNVYVLSVARRLAQQGVAVDIYTRCRGSGAPEIEEIGPGSRIIQVQAGPCAPVPKEELPGLLPMFLGGVLDVAAREHRAHRHSPYDVVHSHYWLSGWVGRRTKEIWGAPLVASFHTLGKVKNGARPSGEPPEPRVRLTGEHRVVAGADRILAPTPTEAAHLVDLYGADPHRIRIVAPGVDRTIFAPRSRSRARAELGLTRSKLLLFAGRLQPLKGPDVAIRALAEVLARAPALGQEIALWVLGGPSAGAGEHEIERLRVLSERLGVADNVSFHPALPHELLATVYSAADAVLVPSRTESFGLVALEAQACGTPVIGTAVGGLRYVVRNGVTGFLVDGHDPGRYADRILALFGDPVLAARFSGEAVRHAARFTWEATADHIRGVYREVLVRPA